MTLRDRNAELVSAQQIGGCLGDGEIGCLACGRELDPDDARELRNGLCYKHLPDDVHTDGLAWRDGDEP